MNLATAQKYADAIEAFLSPYFERAEIAGSVRRQRPNCNDIDIVCIPKVEIEKDMFGTVTGEKNMLWEFLASYVASGQAKFQSGGNVPGKFAILQLNKCQLDVYFATPETFATRLLCRTGSKEHNIFIATHAQDEGYKWEPYEGLRKLSDNTILPVTTEAEIYRALRLEYIVPDNREEDWIIKNLGFDL